MPNAPDTQCILDLARHEDWIRSIAGARLRCSDAVDDVFSEVTHDALTKRATWHEIRAPGPWLYRLTIRKILLYRRKQGRQRKLASSFADVVESNKPIPEVLDQIIKDEDSNVLRKALAQMSGKDAEILILKYVHHWNYVKISENLGIKKNKIANRLRTARQRLRKELQRRGFDGI